MLKPESRVLSSPPDMSDIDVPDIHAHDAPEHRPAVPAQARTFKEHVAQRARQGCPIPGSDDELAYPAARAIVAQGHASTARLLCSPHAPRSAECTRGARLAFEEAINCCVDFRSRRVRAAPEERGHVRDGRRGHIRERCCFYLQGLCRFGSRCWFDHSWGPGVGGGPCRFGLLCWAGHLQSGVLSKTGTPYLGRLVAVHGRGDMASFGRMALLVRACSLCLRFQKWGRWSHIASTRIAKQAKSELSISPSLPRLLPAFQCGLLDLSWCHRRRRRTRRSLPRPASKCANLQEQTPDALELNELDAEGKPERRLLRIYYTLLSPAVVALCREYRRNDACLLSTMRAPPESEQKTAVTSLWEGDAAAVSCAATRGSHRACSHRRGHAILAVQNSVRACDALGLAPVSYSPKIIDTAFFWPRRTAG